MPRNIEIKARIDSVEAVLPRARKLARSEPELIDQDDTFFNVPLGRLKLREFADGSAELIHYHRTDHGDACASDYVRVPAPDPTALREALTRACGAAGRVRKRRWLLMAGATRIHLDRVEGLGDFMELEVVLAEGQTDADGAAVAEALMQALGLRMLSASPVRTSTCCCAEPRLTYTRACWPPCPVRAGVAPWRARLDAEWPDLPDTTPRETRMSLDRRSFNALLVGLPLTATGPAALAQAPRDRVSVGVVLEPLGLDPTTSSAGSIGEISHLNIFEGLTRIAQDGAVLPLLAETWDRDEDGKSYTFKLRRDVRFSDGKPFTSAAVKFSFDRARDSGSTNKARQTFFEHIKSITTPDAYTVVLVLDDADGMAPFRLGENSAVILHPDSAAQAATRPVGTGPFTLEKWDKGKSLTLVKWDGHRNAAKVRLRRVTFRFLEDPAAQVAALRSGSIDAMPRFGALQSLNQFRADRRFVVEVGGTSGKGILAINNRRPPFDDVRVRRALSHAIDRKAFIDGAQAGLGTPIGSHFSPFDLGYVDLTKVYPYDPAKARALLIEAGVTTPLEVTLALPPPEYARRGGPIIAAQLARVGIQARLQNMDWDEWLAGPFTGNFDLTLINHVEPLDYAAAYANPDFYFGYDSTKIRGYVATLLAVPKMSDKGVLWRDIQRQITDDAVNVFIWNPAQVAVMRRGLRGLWSSSPIVVNDMAAVSWAPPATAA